MEASLHIAMKNEYKNSRRDELTRQIGDASVTESPMPRILVVEDEEGTASAISRLLERKLEAFVECAGDLQLARQLLSEKSFDVVTLDHKLPDGNGLELMKELSRKEGRPSVIVISALGDNKILKDYIAFGAYCCVVKDENMEENLILEVRRVLAGR